MARITGRMVAVALGVFAAAACAFAQSEAERGRVDFSVVLTPNSGRPEPARALTVYLLRKSFSEIQQEEEEKTPKPDIAAFLAPMNASKELKDWMIKHHSVTISGPEFRRVLAPDDVFKVPEFLDAFVAGNMSGLHQGFPEPHYNPDDRIHNPQKYEAAIKAYEPALRRYMAANSDSLESMDTILNQIDPTPGWLVVMGHWRDEARRKALLAAETRYLAAKTDTGLDGRGAFEAAPGTYMLSTLEGEALSGNLQLRWNVPVEIHAGRTTRIELNNLNAEKKP